MNTLRRPVQIILNALNASVKCKCKCKCARNSLRLFPPEQIMTQATVVIRVYYIRNMRKEMYTKFLVFLIICRGA